MKIPLFADYQNPLLFAHRGCSGIAPENTPAAFRMSMENGIPGIELDVRQCASGEIVVIHDKTVDRTTDGTGLVEQLSLDEIKALDAGSWFSASFKGERVPLIEEVFALCGDRVLYDIEIKYFKRRRSGIAPPLLELIRRYGLENRVLLSSFNPLVLREFKPLAPKIPRAVIFAKHQEVPFYLRRGEGRFLARCDSLKPRRDQITRKSSARWTRREGYPLLSWTVDDEDEARKLLTIGVRGIISNFPERLAAIADFGITAGGSF